MTKEIDVPYPQWKIVNPGIRCIVVLILCTGFQILLVFTRDWRMYLYRLGISQSAFVVINWFVMGTLPLILAIVLYACLTPDDEAKKRHRLYRHLPRHRKIRESLSLPICLVISSAVGVGAGVLVLYVVSELVARVDPISSLRWTLGLSEKTMMSVLLFLWAMLMYFIARITYNALRYHRVIIGKNCLNCGYDLTGNVSGTCPECGESVRTEQRAAGLNPSEPRP